MNLSTITFFLFFCVLSSIPLKSAFPQDATYSVTDLVVTNGGIISSGKIDIQILDYGYLPLIVEVDGPCDFSEQTISSDKYELGPITAPECVGTYCFTITSGIGTDGLEDICR